MMNMSYCRFENTYKAWLECVEALMNEELDRASEKKYAKWLITGVVDLCLDYGILEEGCDLEALDVFIDSMGNDDVDEEGE